MALTQSDLSSIRTVLREVVQEEVPPIVKEEVKSELIPIRRELKKLDGKFTQLFNFLDKEFIKLKKRVGVHDQLHSINTSEN